MKKVVFILGFVLSGCSFNKYVIQDNANIPPLSTNQGYMGVTVNTIEKVSSIRFVNQQTGENFFIGPIDKGIKQYTMAVEAGDYCITQMQAYQYNFNFKNNGFCVYVEEGELNYIGELFVRWPQSHLQQRFERYTALLKQDLPALCREQIGEGC
ncbi:hypothetical protein FLL45_13565 [Aliikangiella marina]|uniref:Lipoprotein n=1 Tax=Aliikangiella marina TaxID=1712262 RepID=A0A545T9K2_9GAMM|nr:hypothetical protein [Aliikangiella marina]TQV73887.1 hypothetical protein FLL45_13565 [Aliikangiella marina]